VTSAVVFDLGGVLCRFDPDARLRSLSDASGWSTDRVFEHVWGSGRDADADAGRLTADAAFALGSLDGVLDHDQVTKCWQAAFEPAPDVLELVDRVAVRCGLLTNNGPIVEELFAGWLAPVARRCDPVMLSWRLGASKPSREAFDRAAQRMRIPGAELLMVDDNTRNVDGARAAGWEAVQFTTVDALAGELARRGLVGAA
jgi:HAD superfamily hydrolase (TIGR01509 family)